MCDEVLRVSVTCRSVQSVSSAVQCSALLLLLFAGAADTRSFVTVLVVTAHSPLVDSRTRSLNERTNERTNERAVPLLSLYDVCTEGPLWMNIRYFHRPYFVGREAAHHTVSDERQATSQSPATLYLLTICVASAKLNFSKSQFRTAFKVRLQIKATA